MADATCAGCGCACDDIEVTVVEGRLGGLTRTCPLGDRWFAERGGDRPPDARVDGRTERLDFDVLRRRPDLRRWELAMAVAGGLRGGA